MKTEKELDEVQKRRMRIGSQVKQIREEQGFSQRSLAEMCGMKQQHIERIETGRYSTGQDILSRVAQALGKELKIT